MNDGATPLFIASQNGYIDIVRALIAAHAGVDIAANNGATPLSVARWDGHTDIVHALIAAGAT
jgi:ankyrin repeat protein